MIHLNLINHHKGVICNRCHEELFENLMKKIKIRKRAFREMVTTEYFGAPGWMEMDTYYEVTKQWLLKLLRFRIYITVMRRES